MTNITAANYVSGIDRNADDWLTSTTQARRLVTDADTNDDDDVGPTSSIVVRASTATGTPSVDEGLHHSPLLAEARRDQHARDASGITISP